MPDHVWGRRADPLDAFAAAVEGDVRAIVAHRERALGPARRQLRSALGVESGAYRFLVRVQLDRDQGPEIGAGINDQVMLQTVDERSGDT